MTLTEWSRKLGVEVETIKRRIATGMSEEKVFYSGNLSLKGAKI